MKKIVGCVTEHIENILHLTSLSNRNIYMGASNVSHMKSSHPADYNKYKNEIKNILASPDYVGVNPKDNSSQLLRLIEVVACNYPVV